MKIYTFKTVIDEGYHKGKTVEEVFNNNPGFIFKTIKRWKINGVTDKCFDDEVLNAAHITKVEHEHSFYQEEYYEPRDKDGIKQNTKKLKKDTKSINEILDEYESERDNSKYKYADDVTTDENAEIKENNNEEKPVE